MFSISIQISSDNRKLHSEMVHIVLFKDREKKIMSSWRQMCECFASKKIRNGFCMLTWAGLTVGEYFLTANILGEDSEDNPSPTRYGVVAALSLLTMVATYKLKRRMDKHYTNRVMDVTTLPPPNPDEEISVVAVRRGEAPEVETPRDDRKSFSINIYN